MRGRLLLTGKKHIIAAHAAVIMVSLLRAVTINPVRQLLKSDYNCRYGYNLLHHSMKPSSLDSILIVGTAWHGNFSRFLFSSMQNMGLPCLHISTRYEQKPSRILNALQYRLFVKKLNASLRRSIERERVKKILLIAPYNILPETWQLIKEKKIPIIGWFGDNPFTKGIIFDSLKYCDRVFLIDEAWVDRVRYLHPRVAYLPHAADGETFFPLQQNKTYTHGRGLYRRFI